MPLRVGIILDSFCMPAWQFTLLARVRALPSVNVSLVIIKKGAQAQSRIRPARGANPGGTGFLARCLSFFIGWLEANFQPAHDALALADATARFEEIPRLELSKEEFADWSQLPAGSEARIREYSMDVLIGMGDRIPPRGSHSFSKFGVWYLSHRDPAAPPEGPIGFREVNQNIEITGSALLAQIDGSGNSAVLYRSASATIPISIRLNNNQNLWKSVSFIPRVLERLHYGGGDAFGRMISEHPSVPSAYGSAVSMRNPKALVSYVCKNLARRARNNRVRKRFNDQWILMYRFGVQWADLPVGLMRMDPPEDRIWADPHVLTVNGKHYIFFEEMEYSKRRGHISVMTMDGAGGFTEPRKILEREYHLSYPFVFRSGDEYYMVPETAASRSIELYRCTVFPDRWEFAGFLMRDVHAVDSTLFQRDGKWWLFTNMVETPGASSHDELFLFCSDSLIGGEWIAHPMNPIVSDVRKSRPAGGIFVEKGRLFRPAQNCAKSYGNGIKLFEILRMDETLYQEAQVGELSPGWEKDIIGTHTLTQGDSLTVIDALIRRPRTTSSGTLTRASYK